MPRILVWDNGEAYSDQAWYFYSIPDDADANHLRHNLERVKGGEVIGVFEVLEWWHGGAEELPDLGELRQAQPCPRCGATGWVERGMGVKCPECCGWGTLDLETCTLCHGERAYKSPYSTSPQPCWKCNQTGRHPTGRQ